MGDLNDPGHSLPPVMPLDPGEAHRAALTVADRAQDMGELRLFLDMLGLTGNTVQYRTGPPDGMLRNAITGVAGGGGAWRT